MMTNDTMYSTPVGRTVTLCPTPLLYRRYPDLSFHEHAKPKQMTIIVNRLFLTLEIMDAKCQAKTES